MELLEIGSHKRIYGFINDLKIAAVADKVITIDDGNIVEDRKINSEDKESAFSDNKGSVEEKKVTL